MSHNQQTAETFDPAKLNAADRQRYNDLARLVDLFRNPRAVAAMRAHLKERAKSDKQV